MNKTSLILLLAGIILLCVNIFYLSPTMWTSILSCLSGVIIIIALISLNKK